MQGTLVERDGKLYVLYSSPCTLTPELCKSWYRVLRCDNYCAYAPLPGDRVHDVYPGIWNAFRDGGRDGGAHTGTVIVDEKATPEHFSREPIPPPKVRGGKELRWYRGQWEKLMAKGWVAA